MITAFMTEPMPGVKALRLIEKVDADGNFTDGITIPLDTIASYRELLGINDPIEVVEALIHISDNGGEPPADPITGEHVYTEAYKLLRLREQAREDAAVLAREEGCCEEEVQEQSSQAAYNAVHIPVLGDECAMDLCRREARRKLGLADPTGRCGEETRLAPAPEPQSPPTAFRMMSPAGGKAMVLEALQGQAEALLGCTRGFLHRLTDYETDQVTPPTEPDPEASLPAAEEVLAKYQGLGPGKELVAT